MVQERQYTYQNDVRGVDDIIHHKGDTVTQVMDANGQWRDADSRLGMAVLAQKKKTKTVRSIRSALNAIEDKLKTADAGVHEIIATLDLDEIAGNSIQIDSTLACDLRNLESRLAEVRRLCRSIQDYQGYSSITFNPRR